jgi:hypothetical protein
VRIAHALVEREVLDANEIRMVIGGKDLPKIAPPITRRRTASDQP